MQMPMLTPELIRAVWTSVESSRSLWRRLEGASLEAFERSILQSALAVPFAHGILRVTHLEEGHSCRVHGVFWSHQVWRDVPMLRGLLVELRRTYGLERIECVVPLEQKSLLRFVRALGFKGEGIMRKWYRDSRGEFHDAVLYAIVSS